MCQRLNTGESNNFYFGICIGPLTYLAVPMFLSPRGQPTVYEPGGQGSLLPWERELLPALPPLYPLGEGSTLRRQPVRTTVKTLIIYSYKNYIFLAVFSYIMHRKINYIGERAYIDKLKNMTV